MDDKTPLPPLTLGQLWAIRRDVLPRLVEAHRGASGDPAWAQLAGRMAEAAPQAARRAAERAGGAVAVLPLTGVITPRGSLLSMLFGGGSAGLMGFRESFHEAVASPDVGAIVLDVDSPGGLVDLVPETAAEIAEARGSKPIVAVANTMAASAAYWIAAQADELVVTPSGEAGSIGVYMVHEDWSAFNESFGVQPTYISAGRYKTEGNMDEPLSEEGQEAWQQEVDDIHASFVADVAAGRGVSDDTVRSTFGEGRMLLAARALQAGMVDRIDTLENVIADLLKPGSGAASTATAYRAAASQRPRASEETDDDIENPPGPTHEPEEAPEVTPPPEPVEPDVGPDAETPDEDDPPTEADPVIKALQVSLLSG